MIIYCLNHISHGVWSCHSILLLRNMQWLTLRIIRLSCSGIQGSALISLYTSSWVPCSGHNWFDLMGQAETFYNYLFGKHWTSWAWFFFIKICLILVKSWPKRQLPHNHLWPIHFSFLHAANHTSWTSVLHLGSSFTVALCSWSGFHIFSTSLIAQSVKNLPVMQETRVRFLNWKDPLEKEMAIHSSILACKIPWTEEPGGLQSMGLQESDTT